MKPNLDNGWFEQMNGGTMSGDKVVSLSKKREEKQQQPETVTQPQEEANFAEIMRRNKENEERLKKERAKNNKSVTRSYRLKH